MKEYSFGNTKDDWWDELLEHYDTTTIFASEEENPLVTVGLEPLTTIQIQLPNECHGNRFKLSNRFYFGNTTLKVTTVITMSDGNVVEKEVQLDYDYSLQNKQD